MYRFSLLLILLSPILSLSQGLIGKNEKDVVSRVKTAFSNKISEVSRTYTTDGTLVVAWDNYDTKCFQAVYFNKGGIASVETTRPENVSGLNSYIEFYDKMCVKISDTEWKWYLAGKTYRIKLLYNETTRYTFYLSLWD